ncbi:hypothetical protein AIOL_002789 [Candidatus Rhodobacter oscarellae]|uniref:PilZ domain-containing protein n=1 Tax=Candidatus Rhodobacter oscarellae TaxID=1675527 RepID=A0A0J9E502_9RHOB|nr:hypothetical protein AIOL_002789 [Candidatus Rhodobacter lobularis]
MHLPCQLDAFPAPISGHVLDLSYDGACLSYDVDAAPQQLESVQCIEIEDVGVFEALLRWQRDGRVGISFRHPDRARVKVEAFFSQLDVRIKGRG